MALVCLSDPLPYSFLEFRITNENIHSLFGFPVTLQKKKICPPRASSVFKVQGALAGGYQGKNCSFSPKSWSISRNVIVGTGASYNVGLDEGSAFVASDLMKASYTDKATGCDGLNENGPWRLIYLNPYSPVGEGLGNVGLEEVWCGAGCKVSKSSTVPSMLSLLPVCGWEYELLTTAALPLSACLHSWSTPSWWETPMPLGGLPQ